MKFQLLILSVFLGLLVTSCDQCKDVTCMNAGVCNDGDCECPTGFSGPQCELEDKCLSGAVICENDGECVNGECECLDGFSGDSCEEEDKCITEDIDCLNGGDCEDGKCDCLPGYYGDRCQFVIETGPERDDYTGSFDVDEECASGTYAYSSDITAGVADDQIEISNFYEVFTNNVIATVDGDELTIAYQEPDASGVFVEGTGSINEDLDEITIDYTVSNATTTEDCTGTWVRN